MKTVLLLLFAIFTFIIMLAGCDYFIIRYNKIDALRYILNLITFVFSAIVAGIFFKYADAFFTDLVKSKKTK